MATDLIKVEIIERQTVKPSSPTPHSSRTIQLSVLDQMVLSHVYIPTLLFYSGNNNITGSGDKCITKRFVFDASKIATLQSNLASALAPHAPTRVLVVSALIWKCAMEASSKSSNIPPSSFLLTMDLRRWFEPPLPQNLAGNVVGILVVTATASLKGQEESNETIDLKDLVAKLSKGIAQQKETYPTKLPFDSNVALQRAREYEKLRGNVDMYHLCSGIWCRFPFYEADFGWGKPTWVSVPSIGCKDAFYLIDKRDGKGIEALLSLSEEIMEHFESNPELLKYASVNPRVM
ncbi:hypothetical protein GBA52_013521 [Prunus armeniaca]|nr:hypothetical protein GBA52_013521 [Prunus armeniaca]